MSIVIDCSAALVATPRPRAPFAGARLFADDAQPRLENRLPLSAAAAWRVMAGSTMRGFELAGQQDTQDGRIASNGAAYVTATTFVKQHSTRSGPPTFRPPA